MNNDDFARALGRVEEATSELKSGVSKLLDGMTVTDQRLANMEGIADTVDNHAATLLNHEQRISALETQSLVSRSEGDGARQANQRWQRGVIGAATVVGAAAGSAGTAAGPKVWKLIADFFKFL